jgi:hypothetical protein
MVLGNFEGVIKAIAEELKILTVGLLIVVTEAVDTTEYPFPNINLVIDLEIFHLGKTPVDDLNNAISRKTE